MSSEKRTNACCRPPRPLRPPPAPPVLCHTSPSTGRCFSASPPPLSDGARTVWRGVAGGHRAMLPPQLLCPPPHILCNLHLDDAKSWSATANLEGFAGEPRGIAREIAGDVREWGILGAVDAVGAVGRWATLPIFLNRTKMLRTHALVHPHGPRDVTVHGARRRIRIARSQRVSSRLVKTRSANK